MFPAKPKKEQITFRIEGDTLGRLKNIEKYHSKITDIIDLGIECYENNITMDNLLKLSMNKYIEKEEPTISEKEKSCVRVSFVDEKGRPFYLKYLKNITTITEKKEFNPYDSTLLNGWEDLDMREDRFKLDFYNTTKNLVLGEREFEVVRRWFKADYPVILQLYLKEID